MRSAHRSTPVRATRDGVPGWRFPSGRWFPLAIAGGADDPAPATGETGSTATTSVTVTEPTPAPAPPAPERDDNPDDDDKLGDAGKAALEAERKRARDAEKRAKAAEQKIQQAEQEARAADERAKAEQGRYRELWESEKERADTLQRSLEERDAADAERARKGKYLEAGRRLGFRDAEAAYAILAYRNLTGSEDENVIEHELTKLRDERLLPVDERKRTGGDISDPSRNGEMEGVTPGRSRIRMARRA